MCPRMAKKAKTKRLKAILDPESVAEVVLFPAAGPPVGPPVVGVHEAGHELSALQSAHFPSFKINP